MFKKNIELQNLNLGAGSQNRRSLQRFMHLIINPTLVVDPLPDQPCSLKRLNQFPIQSTPVSSKLNPCHHSFTEVVICSEGWVLECHVQSSHTALQSHIRGHHCVIVESQLIWNHVASHCITLRYMTCIGMEQTDKYSLNECRNGPTCSFF